jgi:hypothetical protein
MGKFGAIMAGLVAMLTVGALVADDRPTAPADFKIQVGEFALKKEAVATAEIVVRQGRAYVFPSDSKEVVVIEPARKRVELVEIGRKVQAEVTFQELDESLEKLKKSLGEAADAREKLGGRGNVLEARMARDLFLTKFEVAEGRRPLRVRLANPSVEIDADGVPEGDAARLAMTADILTSIAKLGAFRVPNDLPPFAELEAIATLTGERKLRPTRLSYLYRLAGPPRKFHRTYLLVPTLTDREVEAIVRVDRLREVAPSLRYERYRTDR